MKHRYNNLVRQYFKYKRKLANLIGLNRNKRRQGILTKHIARLERKLSALKLQLGKGVVAATVIAGSLAFIPTAQAQVSFEALTPNPFAGLVVGDNSTPTFVDVDGDGDMDLVSGFRYGYYGSFAYFQNDGNGNYVEQTGAANPFDTLLVEEYYSSPAFADIDGDGDMDLVSGGYASGGQFFYFENDGGMYIERTGASNPFDGFSSGSYNSTPTFVDLDGDGDIDLVSGDYYGGFAYFQNDGSGNFTQLTGNANPLNGVSNGDYNSTPAFADLDGDGDMDLLSGDSAGLLIYFTNEGAGGFTQQTGADNPFDGLGGFSYSAPAFVDLDSDGDMDVVIGDSQGVFTALENTSVFLCPGDTVTWMDDGAGGFVWNPNPPTNMDTAIIAADYDTATMGLGNITACQLTVNTGATLTVAAGDFVEVVNDITVDGTLNIEHTANVVQVSDAAVVTNNGAIDVAVSTPMLDTRDFIMLGSPMDSETREGVWQTAFNVQDFDASLFVPFTPQEAGVVANFQSTNLDCWNPATGTLNAGEGYLVFPQLSITAPGGVFNYNYTSGTLNTGVITQPLVINDAMDETQNANILSNPYASAISATDFLDANDGVNAVYFWEHGAPSSPDVPGPEARNNTMRDVSIFNSMGGMMAASGAGTAPDGIIATAQGFGVFASQTGNAVFNNAMRVTTGNTTLRTAEVATDKNRLWLQVEDLTYGERSNTLIGFTNEATAGFDAKFDSGLIDNAISIYSHIGDDFETGYAIQGREAFDDTKEVNLGFLSHIADAVDYKISITDFDGLAMENVAVYLIDNALGTVTNLKETNYVFNANEGAQAGRFKIGFRQNVLATESFTAQDVSIFPNPTSRFLDIATPEGINAITITDITGRTVRTLQLEGETQTRVDMENLGAAIYFVNVTTPLGEITKRVIKK